MSAAKTETAAVSDPTLAVFAGGNTTGPSVLQNVIEFVQILTTGNVLDIGDLHAPNTRSGSTSSGHGGL